MRTLRPVSLALLSLALAGCGSSVAEVAVEKAIEQETGGEADVDLDLDGGMRIETEDGVVVIGAKVLPSDWPTDVPVYPGATVVSSTKATPADDEMSHALTLTTTDPPATVLTTYTTALKADGWKIGATATIGESIVLSATKEDRQVGVQAAPAEPGKTMVNVVVGQEA
jgi:hypothetical protein